MGTLAKPGASQVQGLVPPGKSSAACGGKSAGLLKVIHKIKLQCIKNRKEKQASFLGPGLNGALSNGVTDSPTLRFLPDVTVEDGGTLTLALGAGVAASMVFDLDFGVKQTC